MTPRAAFMITGIGVHDRPESVFTINWIACSRSNGISVHDPPERAVSHKIDWLAGDSCFPGIKSVTMVENTVERNGETSCERRYYICSVVLLAVLFANAERCHLHIENRLHWVLDVIFREDLSRLRTGCGPHNMATVCHIVMNLLRAAKLGKSLKVHRKLAAWDPDHPQAILQWISLKCSSDSSGFNPLQTVRKRI